MKEERAIKTLQKKSNALKKTDTSDEEKRRHVRKVDVTKGKVILNRSDFKKQPTLSLKEDKRGDPLWYKSWGVKKLIVRGGRGGGDRRDKSGPFCVCLLGKTEGQTGRARH